MDKRNYLFAIKASLTDKNLSLFKQVKQMEKEVWKTKIIKRHQFVEVKHSDCSVLKYYGCFVEFALVNDQELLLVYPEHLQPTWFYLEDILKAEGSTTEHSDQNTVKTTTTFMIYDQKYNPDDYDVNNEFAPGDAETSRD